MVAWGFTACSAKSFNLRVDILMNTLKDMKYLNIFINIKFIDIFNKD